METKGMFKRIAALTLAALTVVTSSGIDYNLLSANAAESATQVTNVSTESTLQTKNAKVNASSKISFSTDEDLKQAVEDGSYTVDVETNKVKVASIKYNKTLLEMGTDFTATAKRTSATTKKIDGVYKYVYTITITGKGRFTGTAKKTGVTMKSQIKPKVTTKKKTVKKADDNTIDWSKEQLASEEIGIELNSGTLASGEEYVQFTSSSTSDLYGDYNFKLTFKYATINKTIGQDGKLYDEVSYKNASDFKEENIVLNVGSGSKTFNPTSCSVSGGFGHAEFANHNIKVKCRIVTDIQNYNVYINNVSINSQNGQTIEYFGSEPDIAVKKDDTSASLNTSDPLTETSDYEKTITNSSNYDAGDTEHTITINGINGYIGTITKTFKITQKTVNKAQFDSKNFSITGLDKATYTGSEVKPTPTIKYGTIKLKEDIDYNISYYNNKELATLSDTNVSDSVPVNTVPYATITFKGNYNGTIYKPFSITQGNIAAKGTKVIINGNEVDTLGENQTSVDATTNKSYYIDYSPVTEELPYIQLKVNDNLLNLGDPAEITSAGIAAGTKTGDYHITNIESTDGKSWPSVGTWKVTLEGQGNYTGNLTVTVKIQKLSLSADNTKISVVSKSIDNSGNPTVTLGYSNTVNGHTYTNDAITTGFTVKKDTNKASANVKLTITADTDGNYDGSRTIDGGGYGLNLNDAAYDDSAELKITAYDPFTGYELENTGMPYYGKSIHPFYSVQKKDGSNWTPISSDCFSYSEVTTAASTDSNKYLYQGIVTITANDQTSDVYGSKTLYFNVKQHSLAKSESGKFTDDLSADIKPDATNVRSKIDIENIRKNLTLTLKPDHAGKFIYVTSAGPQFDIEDPDSAEAKEKAKDNNTIVSWPAPSISADDKLLVKDKDYTVDFPKDETTGQPTNDGTVVVTAVENGNYSQSAIITLGLDNIENSDFYVMYSGTRYDTTISKIETPINYDEKPHWPENIALWKKAIGEEKKPTQLEENKDYRVVYVDPDGDITDKHGYILNGNYQYTNEKGAVVKDAVYADSDGELHKSTGYDLKVKTNNKVDNGKFAKIGNYKILLIGLSDGTTGYFGQREIDYSIEGSKSTLSATFNISQVPYECDKDGTNKTVKPTFAYIDKDTVPDNAPVLTVTANGKKLKDTDYEVDQGSNNFTEPGVKTITVIGKGAYEGKTAEAKYTVYVPMSALNTSDGRLKFTGTIKDSLSSGKTLTLYYNGDQTLKIKTGTNSSENFNPDVTIKTASGNVLNKRKDSEDSYDYTITYDGGSSIENLYSAGDHIIKYVGNDEGVTGEYTVYVNVVVTRANLLWSTDTSKQGGGPRNLILPYKKEGYTIGEGKMALYKTVNGKNEDVTLSSTDDVTAVYDDGTNKNNLSVRKYSAVGTYEVTIKGPLGSNDSTTLTFSILYDLSDLSKVKIDLNKGATEFVYDGKDVYYDDSEGKVDLSSIKVTVDGAELTYQSQYGISRKYEDDSTKIDFSNAGTIIVSLEAVSGQSMYFSDTKPTAEYTITQLQTSDTMKNLHLTINKSFVYNGSEQKPGTSDITVEYYEGDDKTKNYKKLTADTDYTITYPTDSTNAGKKTIVITGKGNYSGVQIFPDAYEIEKYDLAANQSKISVEHQYYTGSDIYPKTIKVSDIAGSLTFGNDYTVTIKKRSKTEETITITGTGTNFKNTTTSEITVYIDKLTLSADKFTVTNATYNRGDSVGIDNHIQLYIPDGNGKDGTILLKRKSSSSGNDYDYTLRFTKGTKIYTNDNPPVDAGTYTVDAEANANSDFVQGSTQFTFTIDPLPISLIESHFEVEDADWTGSPVTPKVTLDGKEVKSSQFTVSTQKAYTDACSKSLNEMLKYNPSGFSKEDIPTVNITATSNSNYSGTISKTFQIGQPFSDATITPVSNTKLTYQENTPQTREFTVSYTNNAGEKITLNPSDNYYKVEYPKDITNAGDKIVTFTSLGGPLYGNATATYTIYPASGSTWSVEFADLTMDSTGQYVVQYQGAAITPQVKAYVIKAGGTRETIALKPSEITYANNTAAGTASVTVKPNNYEGTKTLYFKILGVDLSGDDIYAAFTDGITRRQYTGTALTPAVTVTFAGSLGTVTLRKDVDFSLTYENNTKAGAADVKITGIGNYSGTKTLDFDIFANLNDKTSVFTIPKQMYTGEAITELTGATLKAGGNDLKLGTDYTLSITSTDSFRTKGTAIFTAQGKYYEGTRTVQFEIGNDASMYNILGVASTYVYDRQAHKPVPVVTDKQGTVYSVDSVTYASTSDGDTCINAGNVKMQIVITSHGQSVTIPYNYTIEPKNINTASITPIADVDYNGKAHTPTIRITDGTNLLTGSPTSWDGTADFVYTYYNNVQPGTATVSIQGINNYTGVANVYFAINVKAAPQMIVTAMPSGRLKVTWKKVSGVSGYRIFYSSANGTQKQTTLSSSKKSTYITGLTRGVVYTVGLQSFITANGQNGYSTASVQQIATSTSKPKITSAKSTGKGKIKITWKKVSNATAYMVYRKTAGSSKWVRVKTTKSTSFTNTGLKSGKKYTYKVISYKQSGVKRSFSKYSTGKTVKAR